MDGLAVDGFYDRDCTTISSVNSLPELPEDNGKGLTKLNGGIGYSTVQYSTYPPSHRKMNSLAPTVFLGGTIVPSQRSGARISPVVKFRPRNSAH